MFGVLCCCCLVLVVFGGREVVRCFGCLLFSVFFFFSAAVMPYVQFALTINEDSYKLLNSFLYILFFSHTHF